MTNEVMTLQERQQLEQFDQWLEAKYREVCREWSAETNPEVKEKYSELLKNISAALTAPTAKVESVLPWPAGEDAKRAVEEYMAAKNN